MIFICFVRTLPNRAVDKRTRWSDGQIKIRSPKNHAFHFSVGRDVETKEKTIQSPKKKILNKLKGADALH